PPPADVHGGRGGRRRGKGGLVLTAGPRDGSPFRSSSTGIGRRARDRGGDGRRPARYRFGSRGDPTLDLAAGRTSRASTSAPPARASAEPLDQPPALPLHLARQPSVELAEELADPGRLAAPVVLRDREQLLHGAPVHREAARVDRAAR